MALGELGAGGLSEQSSGAGEFTVLLGCVLGVWERERVACGGVDVWRRGNGLRGRRLGERHGALGEN